MNLLIFDLQGGYKAVVNGEAELWTALLADLEAHGTPAPGEARRLDVRLKYTVAAPMTDERAAAIELDQAALLAIPRADPTLQLAKSQLGPDS